MKETGIPFRAEMVNAILLGKKTMTRRVVKPQPENLEFNGGVYLGWVKNAIPPHTHGFLCHYGQTGDKLYVKETLHKDMVMRDTIYDRDNAPVFYNGEFTKLVPWKWKNIKLPAMFMPKWAARIWLEITGIKVERLQDITEEDATKEGIVLLEVIDGHKHFKDYCKDYGEQGGGTFSAQHAFMGLWESINGKKYPWNSNPFVWCISFRRI